MPSKSSYAEHRATLVKKTWTVTAAQENFIRRMTREVQSFVPHRDQGDVTESQVVQALIQFWMESNLGEFQHKITGLIKKDLKEKGSADSSGEGAGC